MDIILKSSIKKIQYEGILDVKFLRKRKDLLKILKEINEGKDLNEILGNNLPQKIIQSFKANFSKYIANNQLTTEGVNFIKQPYIEDNEQGYFSADIYQIPEILMRDRYILTNLKRNSNDTSKPLPKTYGIENDNYEFMLDNEKVRLKRLEQISDQIAENKTNIEEATFTTKDQKFKTVNDDVKYGDNLNTTIKQYTYKMLTRLPETYNEFFEFSTDDEKLHLLKDIKHFPVYEERNQIISSFMVRQLSYDFLTINDLQIVIDDAMYAKSWVYQYMYKQLIENYLSLTDMNELYDNMVLNSGLFSERILVEMKNFVITSRDFKKYLKKEDYNKLSFKLHVMNDLLDINPLGKEKQFSNCQSFDDIVKTFKQGIDFNEVKNVGFLLGYPFAKNSKNKIKIVIEAFVENGINPEQIIIYEKGKEQKLNRELKKAIKKMGVKVKKCSTREHDRFIIFRMKDTSDKIYLTSNEIQQLLLFNTNDIDYGTKCTSKHSIAIFKINKDDEIYQKIYDLLNEGDYNGN